jgi:ribosomal protein S12 methylthiotransferase accessory factor
MWTESVPKRFTYGTHRACDPIETLDRIRPHFSKMGITRLADVTGLDRVGMPVCMAVRPNSKSLSVNQGKGLSLPLAKVSAAMETIESYHAENIQLEKRLASYREIVEDSTACDPMSLPLLRDSVYHPDLPVYWVEGFDLIQEETVWVPYDLVHTDFRIEPDQPVVFRMNSNGLASGNHIIEAISHAICEVVERDATMLWRIRRDYTSNPVAFVDPQTIGSPACRDVLRQLSDAALEVYISHQTSSVGIPAFGCSLVDLKALNPFIYSDIYAGYGAHLSKEIAILRAVTEAVQSRLTFIAGARDDMFQSMYRLADMASYQESRVQRLQSIPRTIDYRELPSLETDNLVDDVKRQLQMVQNAGFNRAIFVDLTQQEIDIPVVRVIIPGMEYEHHQMIRRHIGERGLQVIAADILFQMVEEKLAV